MIAVTLIRPRQCPNCRDPKKTHQIYNFECPYCQGEFCVMCFMERNQMDANDDIILCPHCKQELECKNPFRNMTVAEIEILEKMAQEIASE